MSPHATSLPDLLTAFLESFSEFASSGNTTIAAALERARSRVDPDVFGACDDEACMLLAADILAASPGGNAMRIKVDGNPTTTYRLAFDRLVLQNAAAHRPST
jgi:hypothetical protein